MIYSVQKTRASFGIYGDQLDPDDWTRYFAVTPDSAARKGDFAWRSGRWSQTRARSGVWSVRSPGSLMSTAIDDHMEALSGILRLPRPDLRARLAEHAVTARFFIFVANYDGDNPPRYTERSTRIADSCGVAFEIDLYPQEQTFVMPDSSEVKCMV